MQFGQYQIYVLRNDADLIKIGITQHYDERVKSLSGSNGGGHKIIDEYVSPYTYLYTLENRFHMIYKDNRVPGTEWFKELNFGEVVNKVKDTFESVEYYKCNRIREKINKDHVHDIIIDTQEWSKNNDDDYVM